MSICQSTWQRLGDLRPRIKQCNADGPRGYGAFLHLCKRVDQMSDINPLIILKGQGGGHCTAETRVVPMGIDVHEHTRTPCRRWAPPGPLAGQTSILPDLLDQNAPGAMPAAVACLCLSFIGWQGPTLN